MKKVIIDRALLYIPSEGPFNTRNTSKERQTQPQSQLFSGRKGNKTVGSASKTATINIGKENVAGLFNKSNDALSNFSKGY